MKRPTLGMTTERQSRFPAAIAAGAILLGLFAAHAATYNGVSYSESTDIAVGRWTSQFAKAKTYAYKKNIPLLVVWVNPECGYCERFEKNVLASSSVSTWLKKRGYVGAFAINTITPGADSASSFIGSVGKYPKCAVYWKPKSGSAIKYSFTGRNMSAATYESTVDGKVGSYAGVGASTQESESAASVTAAVNGLAFTSKVTSRTTNVVCGVGISWPVKASGQSTATVTMSGLPSGLSYSQKTGCITGVPSRAQTNTVKIAVKTVGGAKVTYALTVAVRALPVWAKGTFNGGSEDGLLTVTVSAAGKISGKYLAEGQTWTLSASSYARYDAKKDAFHANIIAKCGKVIETNAVTVTGDAGALLGQISGKRFTGWWNAWKDPTLKSVAKVIDRATNVVHAVSGDVPGTVKLSFGASGSVTAKGVFIVGKNAKTGKDITHSSSCATFLSRTDESEYMFIYIYFPPKKNVFDGYVDCLSVSFDGKNIIF